MNDDLPDYVYRGARVLVQLQDRQLREFLDTWREAHRAGIRPGPSSDPDYASLETILHHTLEGSRGYLLWLCRSFELADPGIPEAPPPETIAAEADAYLERLLEAWKTLLAGIPETRFVDETFPTSTGKPLLPELLLEHAVVHPMRHTFQIRNWLDTRR